MIVDKDYQRAELAVVRATSNATTYAVKVEARQPDGRTATKWLNLTHDEMVDVARVIVGDAVAIRRHGGESYRTDY